MKDGHELDGKLFNRRFKTRKQEKTIYVSIRNPSQSTTFTPSYFTSFDRSRPALSKTKPLKKNYC